MSKDRNDEAAPEQAPDPHTEEAFAAHAPETDADADAENPASAPETARTRTASVAERTGQMIAEHPLAAVAAAVAIGAVAARLLPKGAKPAKAVLAKKLQGATQSLAGKPDDGRLAALLTLPTHTREKAEHLIGQISEATRRANAVTTDAADAARTGLHNARTRLGEMAAETVRRAEIEARAARLADSAADATARLSERFRRGIGKPPEG